MGDWTVKEKFPCSPWQDVPQHPRRVCSSVYTRPSSALKQIKNKLVHVHIFKLVADVADIQTCFSHPTGIICIKLREFTVIKEHLWATITLNINSTTLVGRHAEP